MEVEQDHARLWFPRTAPVLGNERQSSFTICKNLQQIWFTEFVESVTKQENIGQVVFNNQDCRDAHLPKSAFAASGTRSFDDITRQFSRFIQVFLLHNWVILPPVSGIGGG
jgi:hypothetical protein